MKNIFIILLLLSFNLDGISQTKSKDKLTWYGKPIQRRALEDSLRVAFFKNCDCLDSTRNKRIIRQLSRKS
jgi:hypothetical protein